MVTRKMSFNMPVEMHKWIQSEAEKRGLTMNAILILAIEMYQQRMDKK